jgi:hypothetical protein
VSFECFGQAKIKKKELRGEWYTSNDDSTFFYADTLILVKRSDSQAYIDRMCVSPEIEKEKGILNCAEFVNMEFKKRSSFEFWLYEGYSSEIWLTPMKWKLYKDTISVTSLDINWLFKVISRDTLKFTDQSKWYSSSKSGNLWSPVLKLVRVEPDVPND